MKSTDTLKSAMESAFIEEENRKFCNQFLRVDGSICEPYLPPVNPIFNNTQSLSSRNGSSGRKCDGSDNSYGDHNEGTGPISNKVKRILGWPLPTLRQLRNRLDLPPAPKCREAAF